jgi:ATP-binding cassette subfamily C protein
MIDVLAFRRLFSDIWSVVGTRYALYLCLLALTGLLEGLTLASVVPLLAAIGIGEGGSGVGGVVSRTVLGLLGWLGFGVSVPAIAALILVSLFFSTVVFLAQAYMGISLQTTYVSRWQRRLLNGIFAAKWGLFLKTRNGDLINSVVTETQRLGGAFYQTGLLLTGLLHSAIYMALAAMLSGLTTLGVIAGGAFLFLITRPLIQRAYRIGAGISHENAELQVKTGEFVGSAKLLKATATENEALRVLGGIIQRLRRHTLANGFDAQIVKGIFDFGSATMVASILVISRSVLNIDAAVILVILAIFVRLIPKLTGLQQSLQSLTSSLPAVANLNEVARTIEAEAEVSSQKPLPEALASGPLAVSLQNIAVSHDDLKVIQDLSMVIPAGACVALVGRSGAGKSTLVDAMLGLVPISTGSINVNGVDLRELPLHGLRRRIGYMGQETMLYNSTIRGNILWSQPHHSDDAVMAAAALAAADGFISQLPHGLDTMVGDRGGRLSGGERQRLGLARALLGNPGLLVLDEAASALDAETDAAVTRALELLKGKVTMIVISHRLSSVRMADYIYVLDKGQIVESGTWADLEGSKGQFSRLL